MENGEAVGILREGRAALRTVFLDFLRSDPAAGRLVFREEGRKPLAETLDRVLSLALEALETPSPEREAAWLCGMNALVTLTPARPLTAARTRRCPERAMASARTVAPAAVSTRPP